MNDREGRTAENPVLATLDHAPNGVTVIDLSQLPVVDWSRWTSMSFQEVQARLADGSMTAPELPPDE